MIAESNKLLLMIHKNNTEALAELRSYPKSKVEYLGFEDGFFEFLVTPDIYYSF